MNRFLVQTVLILGGFALATSSAMAKKREKAPDLFDECPVKETIRVASENSIDGLQSLANCDDIEVAVADPEDFRIRAPVRFAPVRGDQEVEANDVDVIDPDQVRSKPKSVVASIKRQAGKKQKEPPFASRGVTQTGHDYVRIAPIKQEVDYDALALAAALPESVGTVAAAQTSVPMTAGAALNGESILVMRPQSYATSQDALIAETARRHRIDPLLLHAVIKQESGYKVKARSWVGARGLMQIMPGTGAMLGVRTEHLEDPATNIDAGARLLRKLAIRYNGNFDLVLAAYNAGEGAVQKYGNRIPPYKETQNYVRSVMAHYNKLLIENIGSVPAK
jgi:hypothetical protein